MPRRPNRVQGDLSRYYERAAEIAQLDEFGKSRLLDGELLQGLVKSREILVLLIDDEVVRIQIDSKPRPAFRRGTWRWTT